MIANALKQMAMQFSNTKVFDVVVNRAERRNRHQSLLRVLAYHRVDHVTADSPYYPGLISTSPEQFEVQMQCIASGYYVCSMDEVVAAANNQHQLPANSVLLTFDDATLDFAQHAWPILNALELPATVFVPTAYPDNRARHFWWDRLYRAVIQSPQETTIPSPLKTDVTLRSMAQRKKTFRALKEYLKTIPHIDFQLTLNAITQAANVPDPDHNNVLGWDALRSLQKDGATLAPHTHTHPMLNRLPIHEIAQEVRTSCDVLVREIGQISRTLAYPAGGVSAEAVDTMAQEGIKLAFSTQRGNNDQQFRKAFELRRTNVGARTTSGLLRMQLANWGR